MNANERLNGMLPRPARLILRRALVEENGFMTFFENAAFSLFGLLMFISDGVQSLSIADEPVLAPAEFAIAPPGTIIEGRSVKGNKATKFRIDAIDDLSVTYTRLAGKGGEATIRPLCWAGCNPTRRPIELDRYRELWPLKVGKSVTFRRRSADGSKSWDHELMVLRTETLQTAVGAADTFVVEEKVSWSGGSGQTTYWFAPSLGWWVKYKWSTSNGKSGGWSITSITPPG